VEQTLHHLLTNAGVGNPTARQRTLPPPLRILHRRILHFHLDTALARLTAADLVKADPGSAWLLGSYPFSTTARGYTVHIDGGPTVQAYCAIDALGIPSMLDADVVITSRDPHTGDEIRVTVANGQARWQPDSTVVAVGTDHSPGPSACCRCPYITFHASAATARAYLQSSGLTGRVLSQPQATDVAALLFGGLINVSAEDGS
jgi:alkylmercury lyase-like protein